MLSISAELEALHRTLTMEADEAAYSSQEYRQYWERLETEGANSSASSEDDLLAEVTSVRRKEAHYLARAEALTMVLVRIEDILERHASVRTPANGEVRPDS